MPRIAYITLGCPKNQVDTEGLASSLRAESFDSTENLEDADALIVNTCCFIDDAKKESIDTILQCANVKKRDSKLIVIGCMGQKYRDEIEQGMPEIDAIYGVAELDKIKSYLKSEIMVSKDGRFSKGTKNMDACGPARALDGTSPLSSPAYAYVKIADGCNRQCSFCVIPSIRGKFRSLAPGSILEKVSEHLHNGKAEIILVAQDITEYGRDLGSGYTLARLVREICALEGDFRVRLLYLHPRGIGDELLAVIADEKKVCKYIDMPIQHSEDRILNAMKRGHDRNYLVQKINEIRRKLPNVVLRTTLIVGFPGETDADFASLLDFIRDARFDRLGVFRYSSQQDTAASVLKKKVSKRVRDRRYDEIMRTQSVISLEMNRDLLGKKCRVLIDEVDAQGAIGRTCGQAPEIDGVVFIAEPRGHVVGDIVDVHIDKVYDYDLEGEILNSCQVPSGSG